MSFLEQLTDNAVGSTCELSACISMRRDTAVSNKDSGMLEIHMKKGNSRDIYKHVYEALSSHASGGKLESLAKDIWQRSSNNFLRAEVVVKKMTTRFAERRRLPQDRKNVWTTSRRD